MLFAPAAFRNKKSLRLNVTQGFFIGAADGSRTHVLSLKADVLAVVRQPRNNSTYYTHLRGCLSSPPGRVFLPLLPFCHFILHFAPFDNPTPKAP